MAGALTISTLKDSSGVLATQNGMTGIAKAWVQFNGPTAAINGSFNVSSITRNSAGDYTVNFTTAMPNANYAVAGGASINTGITAFPYISAFSSASSPYYIAPTTSSFRILITYNGSGSNGIDPVYASIVVVGN
jgi:hypothetical protein